jgi:hypothetical protein
VAADAPAVTLGELVADVVDAVIAYKNMTEALQSADCSPAAVESTREQIVRSVNAIVEKWVL